MDGTSGHADETMRQLVVRGRAGVALSGTESRLRIDMPFHGVVGSQVHPQCAEGANDVILPGVPHGFLHRFLVIERHCSSFCFTLASLIKTSACEWRTLKRQRRAVDGTSDSLEPLGLQIDARLLDRSDELREHAATASPLLHDRCEHQPLAFVPHEPSIEL